jgi:hypothetical protein
MNNERDYGPDKEGHPSQHSCDVKGCAILLSGCRRGDAEEVNETCGNVSEKSHRSWMVADGSWTVNLLLWKLKWKKRNRRRACASIFAVLAAATVGAYTYKWTETTRRTADVDRNSNPYP